MRAAYTHARVRERGRDLKVEVKARKGLLDVAIVCPATKSVVARQNTHLHPGVSAKAGLDRRVKL
jgi:hypothetical protein